MVGIAKGDLVWNQSSAPQSEHHAAALQNFQQLTFFAS